MKGGLGVSLKAPGAEAIAARAVNVREASDLERVPCDLCGSDRPILVFNRPDLMHVVRCAECGLMYLDPRPSPATIEGWYSRDYFCGSEPQRGRGYSTYLSRSTARDLRRDAEQKLELVGNHVNLRGADVLELGCATGEASYAAAEKGAGVVGWDLSAEAIRIARSRYPQVEFCSAPVDRLSSTGVQFDAIMAFELIEHLMRPSELISEAYRLLRPGGILALTTPNADRGRSVGWEQWSGFLTSFEHLYFFDSVTLTELLSRQGFSVVGSYSHGDGRIERPSACRFKGLLQGAGLFTPARALYRAIFPVPPASWTRSQDLHTLMLVAQKS